MSKDLQNVCARAIGRGRVVAPRLASVVGPAVLGLLMAWPGCGPAQEAPSQAVERAPTEHALQALRRAWLDEIDELTAITRKLAVADDSYDFVAHPNLPYVYDHYDARRLAADRIDTVLIINRQGKPLFWRRVQDRSNRGFPDAEAFLAQLPALTPSGAAGIRSLAGAARLTRGPSLVVALPIYPANGSGGARGWLITARALDATQWHLYEELAHVTAEVLDPGASTLPAGAEEALRTPLEPVLHVEASHIRGFMAVRDLKGRPFRVFSVQLPASPAAISPSAPVSSARRRLSVELAAISAGSAGLAIATWMVWRRRRRVTARAPLSVPPTEVAVLGVPGLRTPEGPGAMAVPQVSDAAPPPAAVPEPAQTEEPGVEAMFDFGASVATPAPLAPDQREVPELSAAIGFGSDGPVSAPVAAVDAAAAQDRLRARLAETAAVFRYQPQINLQTGRVAGVEALLCIPESNEHRPATEVAAELEAVGLGFELAELWLQEACSARRFWLRQTGHDFPVSVPVSPRILDDPAFPLLVRRVLADNELSPRFLELEVPEATLGGTTDARRALADLHAAGVLVAIDGFDASKSNLRSLTLLPIAKLRVDPRLVHEAGVGRGKAVLFDGIVGAARGLGIIVCAIGVDSPDLAATIERHGCALAQGAALGPLLDVDQFLGLVRGNGVDTAKLPPLRLDIDVATKVGA
jgi:EAL domain-containing protein (putative c-di-GMP-specific phosphodiesterase class I)/sensor domain CHASE-containing protein